MLDVRRPSRVIHSLPHLSLSLSHSYQKSICRCILRQPHFMKNHPSTHPTKLPPTKRIGSTTECILITPKLYNVHLVDACWLQYNTELLYVAHGIGIFGGCCFMLLSRCQRLFSISVCVGSFDGAHRIGDAGTNVCERVDDVAGNRVVNRRRHKFVFPFDFVFLVWRRV